MQIAEVNKALGSVSYMVDRGFKVVFDKDPDTGVDLSMMVHKETGQATRFRRDKTVWVLDAYCQDGSIVCNPPPLICILPGTLRLLQRVEWHKAHRG